MTITIIGSGNVAAVLGRIFKAANHTINEIVGRKEKPVKDLAAALNAEPCFTIKKMNAVADLFVVAVKDDAVANVCSEINVADKIVVHTCGSVSINVLHNTSKNYGVLYPLQSLRKELNYKPEIPFLTDANNQYTRGAIENFAFSFAKTVKHADDETRLHYHLSAIIASNFTNHLFALTKNYCDKNNINFQLLLPLIEEIINRLHYYDPSAMQTGPAIRGDKQTIEKHIALLQTFPGLKEVYELMSESIQNKRL